MKVEYDFTINNIACEPIYSDGLSLIFELQNNEMFYRKKLDGVLTFVGADYDYIMGQPFETEFVVQIKQNNNLYYTGTFNRLNCEENLDDKSIKVNLVDLDEYTEFLNKYDIKRDIIKLQPELESIKIDKRPILQVYIRGSDRVTCHQGGNKWDEPVVDYDVSTSDLINKYKFGYAEDLIDVVIPSGSLPTGLAGHYVGYGTFEGATKVGGGDYRIQTVVSVAGSVTTRWFSIVQISNNTPIYEGGTSVDNIYGSDVAMTSVGSGGGLVMHAFVNEAYTRVVSATDVSSNPYFGHLPAVRLPLDDIIQMSLNYRFARPYDIRVAEITGNYSVTPTEYGKNNEGNYFDKPTPYPLDPDAAFFPMASDRWLRSSLWLSPSALDIADEKDWRLSYVMRDAYVLHSVIDKLLKQINPNYFFNKGSSVFLYGTASFKLDNSELFITQKTNILKGKYDQAAQFAEISLKQILDMLRVVYDCRWRLDGNELIIEHLHYFKNGGSYLINPTIDLDLTGVYHNKHLRSYSFGTSRYSYDTSSSTSTYEFEWLDSVGQGFKLGPVELTSPLIKTEKTEKLSIAGFNPDVDMMLSNASSIPKDGFALLAAVPTGFGAIAPYELPYVNYFDVAGIEYTMQNGLLALKALVLNYHRHDLAFMKVKIDSDIYSAIKLQRLKKQRIWYSDNLDPIFTRLVRTDLGDGFIQKTSINLTSRRIDLELLHDTY